MCLAFEQETAAQTAQDEGDELQALDPHQEEGEEEDCADDDDVAEDDHES